MSRHLLGWLSLIVLSMVAVSPAWSCDASPGGATCGGSGPASVGNDSLTNQGSGNPINVINGNKFQQEVDLPALPGVLGLEIVRYYNSAYAVPKAPNGIMGRGWKLSYETDLYAIGNTIQIVQADGTRIIFSRSASHPDLCATNDPSQGKVLIHKTPEGEEYIWVWADGRRLDFDRAGKLNQILAPTGEFVSLQYDTQEHLIQVTDPQGRSLHLHYPARATVGTDRFQGVQSIDSPVGRFGYEYGGAPAQGAQPAAGYLANLTRVTQPAKAGETGSVSRIYSYEDPRYPSFLTGISVSQIGSNGRAYTQRLGTYQYDAQGRGVLTVSGVPRQVSKDGKTVPGTGINQVNLDFSQPDRTRLTNSLGQTTQYSYQVINGKARLLEERGAGCSTCNVTNVRYRYDALGQMTLVTHLAPDGTPIQATQTTRDKMGRPISISTIAYLNGHAQHAQLQTRYEYTGENAQPSLIAQPSVVLGREHQIHISYNTAGQPIEVSETGWTPGLAGGAPSPLARTTTYGYSRINGRSLLTEIDGPLPDGPTHSPADSDITRYQWDAGGNYIVGVILPGNLMSRVEARDDAGRPTLISETDRADTRIQYNFNGAATQILHGGRAVTIAYDATGRPVVLHGNDGQTLRVSYEPDGSVRYTLPDGQSLVTQQNTEKQITAVSWLDMRGQVLGTPTRYQYDLSTGQLDGVSLPSGLQAHFGTQPQAGKTSSAAHFNPIASLLNAPATATLLPGRGTLSLTLPTGAVHTQLLDDFGRVVQQTSPERGTQRARYDLADHTVELRDAVRLMTARYDTAGHLLERRHQMLDGSAQRTVHYRWQRDKLLHIDDAAQQTDYSYDAQGRVISVAVVVRRVGSHDAVPVHITRYRYDTLGRLYQTILPEGTILTYRFNAISTLIGIDYQAPAMHLWKRWARQIVPHYGTVALLSDIRSDAARGILAYREGNGEQVSNTYDQAFRRVARQDGPAATRLDYRPDGTINELQRNAQKLQLHYDSQGRLEQVIAAPQSERYQLDANGNRLNLTRTAQPAQSYTYRPASDQLLSVDNQNYHYDAAGSPVSIIRSGAGTTSGRILRYGPMGELIAVEDPSKLNARYDYNEKLQRIAKTVNGLTTYYLWQGNNLAAETNARGRITTRYLYLANRPIAMLRYDADGRTAYYAIHTDHLGTPLQVTNEQHQIVWQAEYDIYGRARVTNYSLHSGTSPPAAFEFNLRQPGQYADSETGYYYNWHRYYDPSTGRYLTADPIGLAGGPNAYNYVDGNPAELIDPWGLDVEPADSSWIPGDGLVFPGQAAAFGTLVHNRVWSPFIKETLMLKDSTSIDADYPFGRLKPDAYQHNNPGGDIWELKPMSWQIGPNYTKAQNQVQGYINAGNSNGNGIWQRGADSVIFGGLTARYIGEAIFNNDVYEIIIHRDTGAPPCSKYSNIHPPNSGLVFYTYKKVGRVESSVTVPNMGFLTEAELLAALRLIGLTLLWLAS